VDRHLRVGGFGHVQAVVNRRRCGAPVFMQLHANRTSIDLLVQRVRQGCVAFAQEAEVHRKRISGLQHALDVPSTRRARRRKRACGGASATTEHGGDATGQGFFNLLRGDEVDVRVHTTRRDDIAFATDDFGTRADDDVHAGLCVGVARFADGHDAPVFQTNVGFDDAPVVNDERVGHHRINRATRLWADACTVTRALRLRHAIANGFATAELHLFTITACFEC